MFIKLNEVSDPLRYSSITDDTASLSVTTALTFRSLPNSAIDGIDVTDEITGGSESLVEAFA
jgi:hypothetical protein